MRRLLPAFLLGVVALQGLSVVGQAAIERRVIPMPKSLKTVVVPKPVGIERFVKDEQAAIALGKALFWDMQAGSDGMTACATCHYHAGVDNRVTNQINPGANGTFDTGRPNRKLLAADFPFRKLSDPENRHSNVVRDRDDVFGSQGVHAAMFSDIVRGGRKDASTPQLQDPLGFHVSGVNVRRTTGRNTPSTINAVFNVRNFWDGRANQRFNGRNPFGDADSNARVLMVNDLGELEAVRISLDMASTASQAVGPPLSDVEMSASGRTFMKLGKKMLSVQPLATQEVKADDSSLGIYRAANGRGLSVTYADLIRAAFHDQWWNSSEVVDAGLNVITEPAAPTDLTSLSTNRYSLMEANFSLFWGLAIAAYEATLVSDDTPYDRFVEGDPNAMTKQAQIGIRVFTGVDGSNCMGCHFGPEFTGAAITAMHTLEAEPEPGTPIRPRQNEGNLQRMFMADRQASVYDGGYYNLGVRPTHEDIGLGATDPFGNPLSEARREQLNPGSIQNTLFPPMQPGERIAADGAFKTPTLRNVELTGPYFHNGGMATLGDVIDFYARGGDFHETNLPDLDAEMVRQRALVGHPARQLALLAFLKSLTDERVRWYRAPFDHPELVIPNGAQGNDLSVLQDIANPGAASDAIIRLPATGRNGATTPIRPFMNLAPFSATSLPAPNPTTAELALFATDSVTIASVKTNNGDIWSNGTVRITSRQPREYKGDIVAGRSIVVTGDTLVMTGNMMSKGSISLTPNAFLDGEAAPFVEYYAPLAMPALPALPTLPLLQSTVNVPAYGIQTLQPGRYGTLNVGTGAWAILEPGTYVFTRIVLSAGAFLQYDPNGEVDQPVGVAGEFPMENLEKVIVHTNTIDIGRDAIIANGDPRLSTHFKMYVRTPNTTLRLNENAFVHGSIIAPTARASMLAGSSLTGAIYAKTIDVAETADFDTHTILELPNPVNPDLGLFKGIAAGPVNPDDPKSAGTQRLGLMFELGQNAPNPFRPQTTIRFSLPTKRSVEMRVFDVAGRSVKTLAQGPMEPGVHTVQWDGTDEEGRRLSSGVYFYRLNAGRDRAMKKMVIVD
ncbi:MAG: hypothetical protein RL721_1283 [Candidatus Eisenbacteria bacterium]